LHKLSLILNPALVLTKLGLTVLLRFVGAWRWSALLLMWYRGLDAIRLVMNEHLNLRSGDHMVVDMIFTCMIGLVISNNLMVATYLLLFDSCRAVDVEWLERRLGRVRIESWLECCRNDLHS
jgi:hypothetical protein